MATSSEPAFRCPYCGDGAPVEASYLRCDRPMRAVDRVFPPNPLIVPAQRRASLWNPPAYGGVAAVTSMLAGWLGTTIAVSGPWLVPAGVGRAWAASSPSRATRVGVVVPLLRGVRCARASPRPGGV